MILLSFYQDNRIIILDHDAELKYEVGDGYTRIAISQDDISLVDSLVSSFVQTRHKEYRWNGRIEDYPVYYRQYAGYKRGSPQRIVFVNAFKHCDTKDASYLKQHVLITNGGGQDYFRLKVNLETLACFDLSVNGLQ
jgi:hypothetical protein